MDFHRFLEDSCWFCALSSTVELKLVVLRSSQRMLIAWTVAAMIAKAAATSGPHWYILAKPFDMLVGGSYLSDGVKILPKFESQ